MDTARFLLEVGVDGFAVNKRGRSPLSMAIEVSCMCRTDLARLSHLSYATGHLSQVLPELALELLATKSRFEYRWWGNDLYWFSCERIPLV